MPDDGDEFDPAALAAVAEGRDVGSDPAEDPDGGDAEVDAQEVESDADGDAGGAGGSSDGVLSTVLLPLVLADERGPTASTFEEHDVDGGIALILDGVTDYVLDLAGKDVGDSLGPAGKMGLGWSRLTGSTASTTASSSGGGGEQEGDAGDDEDLTGGADIDVEAV